MGHRGAWTIEAEEERPLLWAGQEDEEEHAAGRQPHQGAFLLHLLCARMSLWGYARRGRSCLTEVPLISCHETIFDSTEMFRERLFRFSKISLADRMDDREVFLPGELFVGDLHRAVPEPFQLIFDRLKDRIGPFASTLANDKIMEGTICSLVVFPFVAFLSLLEKGFHCI